MPSGPAGGFTVVEFLDFEGSSVPLHTNDRWDTGFYILDGEYSFVIADETVAASPGHLAVRATGDSARVAVQFDRGAPPQRNGARRLGGLLPPGGRECAGSNTVAGPERTGCRSPVEHGGTVRDQDRRTTARRIDSRERGRVTRAGSLRFPFREQDSLPASAVEAGRRLTTALHQYKSDREAFGGLRMPPHRPGRAVWVSAARTVAIMREGVRAGLSRRGA
jgi:hypothetical protein